MTPADRDAAVALAREIADAWDGAGCHTARVEVLSDGGDYGGVVYDKRHATLARALLALAERPTCATCRHYNPTHFDSGRCMHPGSRMFLGFTPPVWGCIDHQPAPPAPLPSCSICRRDDCGGNHACE